MSVRPSARMEQLDCHWTGFMKFAIWVFFENLVRKFKFHYNVTRIAGTLHEDQYKLLIISRWILVRTRNVSGKSCRENQNTHFKWSLSKVRELTAVKLLHTSLLNTTVVAFKVLPLGSYAPMPAPSPPFKTILELDLWNDLQSCRCINPDVINVIKMPSFQYFLYLREQKKVIGV